MVIPNVLCGDWLHGELLAFVSGPSESFARGE
jgi:hypothetical protein